MTWHDNVSKNPEPVFAAGHFKILNEDLRGAFCYKRGEASVTVKCYKANRALIIIVAKFGHGLEYNTKGLTASCERPSLDHFGDLVAGPKAQAMKKPGQQ